MKKSLLNVLVILFVFCFVLASCSNPVSNDIFNQGEFPRSGDLEDPEAGGPEIGDPGESNDYEGEEDGDDGDNDGENQPGHNSGRNNNKGRENEHRDFSSHNRDHNNRDRHYGNSGKHGNSGEETKVVSENEMKPAFCSVAFDGWKQDYEFVSDDSAIAYISVNKIDKGGNPIVTIEALGDNMLTSVKIMYALNKSKFDQGDFTEVELEITDAQFMEYLIEKPGSPYVVIAIGLN